MPNGPAKATIVLSLPLVLLCSCQPQTGGLKTKQAPPVELAAGRVGAAFEQWLYKSSMLHEASRLTNEAGASTLLWRHAKGSLSREKLLDAAPSWLSLDQKAENLPQPLLPILRRSSGQLSACGIRGVWISSLAEENEIWLGEKLSPSDYAPVSFNIKREAGKEADFKSFLETLEASGLQSGTPLLPVATGIGPDFMLEARGASSHKGLYALWDIPKKFWASLHQPNDPWDCKLLPPDVKLMLEAEDVIPAKLAQDEAPKRGEKRGWAVTGEILCVDGQSRRYAYRWASSPWRPVLYWQHPGAKAKILMAGAAMQTAGIRRQTLTGISLGGLDGLSPAPMGGGTSMHPAPEALSEISDDIGRCGGWSLLLDCTRPESLKEALDKVSFVRCPKTRELLIQAFEGDAIPLASYIQKLIEQKIPFSGLAHGLVQPNAQYVPALDKLCLSGQAQQNALHSMLSFEASLPGPFFLSAGELAHLVRPSGLPGSFFTELLNKGKNENEQAQGILALLALRASTPVAKGTLLSVQTPSKTFIAVANALEGGSILVSAINFSGKPQTQSVELPNNTKAGRLNIVYPNRPNACRLLGKALVFSLQARQASQVLLFPQPKIGKGF